MIIIPHYIPKERGPTEAEQINIASLKFSNIERERECFREGADWFNKEFCSDDSTPRTFTGFLSFIVFILCVVYLAFNAAAFLTGVLDGAKFDYYTGKRVCSLRGKWKYISPGHIAGCHFKVWVDE